jgi:hypothetical protein
LKGFLGLVAIAKDSSEVLVAITAGFCIVSFLFKWWESSTNYELKAFVEEYPGENIEIVTEASNKIRNKSYQLNDT